jgi:hypothetical protein
MRGAVSRRGKTEDVTIKAKCKDKKPSAFVKTMADKPHFILFLSPTGRGKCEDGSQIFTKNWE